MPTPDLVQGLKVEDRRADVGIGAPRIQRHCQDAADQGVLLLGRRHDGDRRTAGAVRVQGPAEWRVRSTSAGMADVKALPVSSSEKRLSAGEEICAMLPGRGLGGEGG